VVGGRLFSLGWRDGREIVTCLDATTGRELWMQSYKCPQYGRLYCKDREGRLRCFSIRSL